MKFLGRVFNEVRMFEGQPVRLWAYDRGGRFVIFPNGRMIRLPEFQVAFLPAAPAAEAGRAFPVQDRGERM